MGNTIGDAYASCQGVIPTSCSGAMCQCASQDTEDGEVKIVNLGFEKYR